MNTDVRLRYMQCYSYRTIIKSSVKSRRNSRNVENERKDQRVRRESRQNISCRSLVLSQNQIETTVLTGSGDCRDPSAVVPLNVFAASSEEKDRLVR